MIYKDLPEKFNPKFEVVSCFVECDGKILLLQRQDNKSQGGKWGVPAGKIDEGESEKLAVLREVKEETGIALNNDSVKHSKKVFVRYPDYDFVFDIFKSEIKNFPDVVLSKEEHKDFRWVTPSEALSLDLILDEDECIKNTYKI
jgi:8-oxo-dGTP diphosphatase